MNIQGMGARMAGVIAAVLAALAGTAFGAAAKGTPAKPMKITHPMQVVIITDGRPGCEPDCAQWIAAEGQIGPETPALFRRVFKALGNRKLPIFISSPGGSVTHAFAIGREIRKRGLAVAVERTIFQKCEGVPSCDLRALKDGDKGRPEPIAAYCASSCVFILAAGAERVVPVYGFVGVHEILEFKIYRPVLNTYRISRKFENWHIVVSRELIAQKQLPSTTVQENPNYAPVRAYFTEMGVNAATIMPLVIATPHDDIRRLTPDERERSRLVTRVAAGDTLLHTAPGPPAAAPAAPLEAAPAAPAASATARPLPVGLQAYAQSNLSAELSVFFPPGGDAIDLFMRVKSPGALLATTQMTAVIQLADGKILTAQSAGSGAGDPLYAALANEEFCALRRAGDLSLKVTFASPALAGLARRPVMSVDLTKNNGVPEYAAKHCGT